MTEKAFRVDWRVDLNASSPQEAACFAREIQEQPNTATVFSVEDKQTGEIHVIDLALNGAKGENLAARMPADTKSRRSLRPGRPLQTRSGLPVEVVEWDRGGEFPLAVRIFDQPESCISGLRTKSGLHPQNLDGSKPHPLDIVEVNPTIEKWVRVYDRAPLNESGKQVVSGKEFAPERGLHWYLFNTEQEARAQLRGVRAVFKIEYQEGEGIV